MSITPWYAGITSPEWELTLTGESGAADLTGLTASNITLEFHNLTTGIKQNGAGTVTIAQANPAIIHYQLANTDVESPGTYKISVIVNYTNGPALYGPNDWQLLSR